MAKPGRKPLDPDLRIAKSWSGSNRPTPHNAYPEARREQIREMARRLLLYRASLRKPG